MAVGTPATPLEAILTDDRSGTPAGPGLWEHVSQNAKGMPSRTTTPCGKAEATQAIASSIPTLPRSAWSPSSLIVQR